jgi:23S rRNA (adenine2503-C2)-methyltransferase
MEVADIAAAIGPEHPRFRARQIYEAVYRHRVTDLHLVSTLPKLLRGQLPVGVPEIARVFDSTDGTRRYLLKRADGKPSKLSGCRKASGPTICISTQVGCLVIGSSA